MSPLRLASSLRTEHTLTSKVSTKVGLFSALLCNMATRRFSNLWLTGSEVDVEYLWPAAHRSVMPRPYRHVYKHTEREMFYLTTHSTHFIYGYMASDIWLRTILIVRKETRCRHIGYSYRLTARVLLYAPSHRQDNTYHSLCYTSRVCVCVVCMWCGVTKFKNVCLRVHLFSSVH